MHLPKGIGSHSPEEVTSELRPMWSTLASERKSGRHAGSQALERGVCPGPWGHGGWGRWGWMGVSGNGVDAGRPRGGAPMWWVNAYSWAGELHRHQIFREEKNFFPTNDSISQTYQIQRKHCTNCAILVDTDGSTGGVRHPYRVEKWSFLLTAAGLMCSQNIL